VKVGEGHRDLFLLVADGEEVSPQISQSRARVNDGDAVDIGERDLQAGRVAAELLEPGIANGDGSSRAVKFELHGVVFMKPSPRLREHHCSALEDVFCLASINTGVFTRRDPGTGSWRRAAFCMARAVGEFAAAFVACCGPTARVLRWRGPTREGDLSSTAGTTRDHAGIRTAANRRVAIIRDGTAGIHRWTPQARQVTTASSLRK
jgi:hypothetical protein